MARLLLTQPKTCACEAAVAMGETPDEDGWIRVMIQADARWQSPWGWKSKDGTFAVCKTDRETQKSKVVMLVFFHQQGQMGGRTGYLPAAAPGVLLGDLTERHELMNEVFFPS